jgi:hypothetical protein
MDKCAMAFKQTADQRRDKATVGHSRDRTCEMIFRFTLSCHAIASRLAVASREGWLASAEALYERRIKREAKLADSYFLIRILYFGLSSDRGFFGTQETLSARVAAATLKRK